MWLFLLIFLPLLFAALVLVTSSFHLRSLILLASGLIFGVVGSLLALDLLPHEKYANWIGLDPLGQVVLLATSILFATCAWYAVEYLRYRQERGNKIFIFCLLIFQSSMMLAIVSRHLGLLWFAVEATTIASAPLIYYNRNSRSIEATWKYMMICSVGIALAMLGIFFIGYSALHAHEPIALGLDDLLAHAPSLSTPWLLTGFVFLLVGFGTKMGLAPLHSWKPDAYGEAPGMVGALLAGGLTTVAFLAIMRSVQIMYQAGQMEIARQSLLALGVVSLVVAAIFVIRQPDFKRMLAYSSVEHVGILAIAIAMGGIALYGGLLHLIANAFIKGSLFLSAGNIHRYFQSKHLSQVSGALSALPLSCTVFLGGFFVVTGTPPGALFISEFTILRGIVEQEHYLLGLVLLMTLAVVFIGMAQTVFRMSFGTLSPQVPPATYHETWKTTIPPLFLLVLTLILGVYRPLPLTDLLTRATALLGGVA